MNEQKQISCPACKYEYPYHDGHRWVCADCGHQWDPLAPSENSEASSQDQEQLIQVKDANGNVLQDGDSVTVIKDLKVKGASQSLKVGTKVKSIRLVPDSSDGHNISCNIPGFGAMNLKSEFVKKI